ncbi:unnamed protein product [Meganyctiphanes norvegica]|uniref:SCP domain-containing protein n=1 Tax=Meganyctiphanes norvegica TaxID=48144 RepID=A0AAV2QB45_MEGNR
MSIGWSLPLVLSALCVQQSAATCNDLRGAGVSYADMELIVNTHDTLRIRVSQGDETRGAPGPQPSAANMRGMEWDEELARKAQNHADQCVRAHDNRADRRVSRFDVGQNLQWSWSSNYNSEVEWDKAIKWWYDEVDNFNPNDINPYRFRSGLGHYTQMMWADTHKIGCGFTSYKEGGSYYKLYTCNYGPGGNINGAAMYKLGSDCSSCPSGWACSWSNGFSAWGSLLCQQV